MQWPWVGRGRLNDALDRLAAVDAERLRLQEILLQSSARAAQAASVEVMPQREETPEPVPADRGTATSFSTPFDRIERRFSMAHKNGAFPDKFRART